MRVNVKILKGPDCSPTVSEETSVHELKRLVANALDIPVERQRLVFKGKAMQDEMSLLHYGVTHDSRVFLSLKDADSSSARTQSASSPSADGACAAAVRAEPGCSSQPDLQTELRTVLMRHFTPDDAERVIEAFNQEMKTMVTSLSLDDIEQIAKANLMKDS